MNTRAEIKQLIIEELESIQGCKITEFVCREKLIENIPKGMDLCALISEMISDGEILEIEYILPNMSYRVKSFLLPKGTLIGEDIQKDLDDKPWKRSMAPYYLEK